MKTPERILIFKIANELFGISVMDIKGINFADDIKPITTEYPYMKGVLVLRGHAISVVDFRTLLNKNSIERNKKQRIIILNYADIMVGLLVDEVLQVVTLTEEGINPAPKTSIPYVFGICEYGEENEIVYMLETEKIYGRIEH